MFRVGTLVCLRDASDDTEGIGTVVNVIPSDSRLDVFALYDVDFDWGIETLHAPELRPLYMGISSCDEKETLLVAHKKAFDIYIRGVRELANAAGVIAHTEFEFLHSRVRTARQFLVETREQLNNHTAEHGC